MLKKCEKQMEILFSLNSFRLFHAVPLPHPFTFNEINYSTFFIATITLSEINQNIAK
jgi:hypothetical protein